MHISVTVPISKRNMYVSGKICEELHCLYDKRLSISCGICADDTLPEWESYSFLMKRIDQSALSRVMLTGQELLLNGSVRTNNRTEMLSDVAVMFAPRAEPLGVRSKMEPWSHHDEYSFMTESESPLAISTAFWDQLIQSEADSNNLFAVTTPHVDRSLQPSTPSFHSYARDTSQGSDSTGSSSYSDQQGDRYKRRRMLQFTGVNTGGFAQDSPPPYESVIGSPTNTYSSYSSYSSHTSSYSGSPVSSVYSGNNTLQPYDSPTLPPSSWFSGSDGTSSFMLPSAQPHADKWMPLQSFDKNQSYCAPVQMKPPVLPVNPYISNSLGEIYSPQAWKRPSPPTPQSNFFLQQHTPPQMQYQQSFPRAQPRQDIGVLQSPLTPFSKPPTPGRKSSSGPSRFKTKSPIPVALPFAMLKPSAAQGDVTLSDINKLLLSPPPTPTDRPLSVEERRPPTPPGAGLSGKSVVACTKIHTEGAGTITIMRTKG
ncbi:hypothetical protein KC19_3G215900 [Ceratodon purpureus]|uniref:Uncharacterized protein n=1 Tax=Ceratodon purpureus TaxID=3225 RepID=A0A8T0INX3_CERPU|nr:hypothetical protein KC19_3G215900 [Ceratodon purpureus]